MSAQSVFLDPADESFRLLLLRRISGPVTMLNLLRFRDWADYSRFPEAAPAEPVTGAQAFDRYLDQTMPFLTASGGSIAFLGSGGYTFVGPPGERWDLVMAVLQV